MLEFVILHVDFNIHQFRQQHPLILCVGWQRLFIYLFFVLFNVSFDSCRFNYFHPIRFMLNLREDSLFLDILASFSPCP